MKEQPTTYEMPPAPPKKKKTLPIVLGVIVAVIVLAAVGSALNSGTTPAQTGSQSGSGAAAQTTPEEDPAISVTAEALFSAYDANQVAADEQYQGQKVQVTGTVKDIGKDILDQTYITLAVDDNEYSLESIQCYFSDEGEIAKVSALSKGQDITLTGTCDGKIINVQVKDCVLN